MRDAGAEFLKVQEEYNKFIEEWDLTEENLNTLFSTPEWYSWENSDKSKSLWASDLKAQYNELSQQLLDAAGSYDEVANSAAQLRVNGDDLARMQAVVNGNYNDASAVMLAYNQGLISANEVEKSRWGSLDNLKNKAKETAEATGNNLFYGLNGSIEKYKTEISNKGLENAQAYLDSFDEKMGIESPSKEMYKRGVWTVQGFINGLMDRSGLSRIWNASKSIASTALNSIKKFLGIASPSKEAEKIGDFFGVGLVNGIVKNKSAVSNAAQTLGESAKIGLSLDNLRNTYASLNKLKSSGIAQKSASINNINNSSSRNINGGINITINSAKLETDADIERFSEQLADTIIRKGMEWG